MSSSRTLLALALSGALLSGAAVSVSPDAFATPAPTQQQLADAAGRVAAAKQGLADVQVRAESATEDYNAAQVAADAAAATAAQAATAAAQAQATAVQAGLDAAAAQGVADQAIAAATAARQAHDAAVAAVDAAQQVLNQLAAGAYLSGGNLALLSTMLAADPTSFATGQAMIDHVDGHQKDSVDALTAAKAEAAATATLADQAQAAAVAKAAEVAARAADAVSSAQAAKAAAATAAATAAASVAQAAKAAAAKTAALVLVDAAQQTLGSASANAAALAAKAEQARLAALTTQRTMPTSTQAPSGSAAAVAIAWAYKEIGIPYSWGGGNSSGPTYGILQGSGTLGFDCSGLTLFAWAHAGVTLPHSSQAQYNLGRHVSFGQLAPGDLIFYASNTSDPGTIHHVTLYIGGGKMIEAPHTGDVVKVSTVYTSGFIGGTRLTS